MTFLTSLARDAHLWIQQNPGKFLVLLYAIGNFIVGVTPKRYQQNVYFGFFLKILSRIAVLTHADAAGTVQIPLVGKTLILGLLEDILAPGAVVVAPPTAPVVETPAVTAVVTPSVTPATPPGEPASPPAKL